MPVAIRWSGRLGNNLFQYAMARLFAEKRNFKLITPWCRPEFLELRWPCVSGALEFTTFPEIEINDTNCEDYMQREWVDGGSYLFTAYSQYAYLLEPHRERICSWFKLPEVEEIGDDAICIHVRLTDHGKHGSLILDPQWYAGILEKEVFKELHIITEDRFATGMFDAYRRWNPEIRSSPNCMDDFNWMRQHTKVILPNSSFSWWSAFTGHAKTVFQFSRGQSIPYIKHALSWAKQVDGKYYHEV